MVERVDLLANMLSARLGTDVWATYNQVIKAAGSDGRYEAFKTTTNSDGGNHRRQHGV